MGISNSKSIVDKKGLIAILAVIFIVLIVILVCVLLYFNIKKPAKPTPLPPPPPPHKCICELCDSSESVNTSGIDDYGPKDPIKNWTLYKKQEDISIAWYVGMNSDGTSTVGYNQNIPDFLYPDIKLYEYKDSILKISRHVNPNYKDAIIDFNKNTLTIQNVRKNFMDGTLVSIEIKIEDIGYDESRELLLLTFNDEDVKKYRKSSNLYELYISKYILISKNLLC